MHINANSIQVGDGRQVLVETRDGVDGFAEYIFILRMQSEYARTTLWRANCKETLRERE